MEFWNLVFMQNERGPRQPTRRTSRSSASCRRRTSTPAWAWSGWPSLLQGVDNLYEIDEIRPILDRAAELTGKVYGAHSGHAAVRVAPRRRPAAGHRRPRAHRADADRRRRDPGQRGARLRAAPDPAPGGPLDAAARLRASRRCPSCCRSRGTAWRRPTRSWPTDFDRISSYAYARGGGVPADAARRARRSSTRRSPDAKTAGGKQLLRRQGVPAARHVRLPDRPDPGDGGRAGPRASTRTGSAG